MNSMPDSQPARAVIDPEALFGVQTTFAVESLPTSQEGVPVLDPYYRFDPQSTLAILMGFALNRRVFIHGLHGSGKSTHIEQVAARLNWPTFRINLDGHVSRAELVGRDVITLEEGLQTTKFQLGMLTWAIQNPVALVLDEYDAGRPDVMFVIQRLLESDGSFTLLEENRSIDPHPDFRLFATANTLGMGDATGQYAGTQPVNQAQLDRWDLICQLDFLHPSAELELLQKKFASPTQQSGNDLPLQSMVLFAELTRNAFRQGDLSTFMSLRTLIAWAENSLSCHDAALAFNLSYLNRCDQSERALLSEFYQRCFGHDLNISAEEEID